MRRFAFFSSIFLIGFTLCSCKSWGKFWEVTICDEGIGYAAMSTASYANRFVDLLAIERDKGSYGSLSVDLTQMPVGGTADKWLAGVLAGNGKIYAIPYSATTVLTIDPATNTANTAGISGISSNLAKWKGGALAPNGKIYAVPESESTVLIIDPDTNTVNTTTITGIGSS